MGRKGKGKEGKEKEERGDQASGKEKKGDKGSAKVVGLENRASGKGGKVKRSRRRVD